MGRIRSPAHSTSTLGWQPGQRPAGEMDGERHATTIASVIWRPVDRWALLLFAVLGCSFARDRNVVTGWITPDYFVFQELVPLGTDEEAGGWRAACVRATMRDGDTGGKVICEIEVGVPIKTRGGWISVVHARETAAMTANQVAYAVLSQRGVGMMLGPACIELRRLFELMINGRIDGAHVRAPCDKRLQPTIFDVTR